MRARAVAAAALRMHVPMRAWVPIVAWPALLGLVVAKRITMHTLRHTAAMRLLLAGNDVTVIALWLGHFSGVGDLSRTVPRSAV